MFVDAIKSSTELMLYNLGISMKTCDWQADICGAPAWRYIYHIIHSCDKYFINPVVFEEPHFHQPDLDWPDAPSNVILDCGLLWAYYERTREKIIAYLNTLSDEQLCETPEKCHLSRFELILGQHRHMYAHIGILNGITISHTGQYPHIVNASNWTMRNLPDSLFAGTERP